MRIKLAILLLIVTGVLPAMAENGQPKMWPNPASQAVYFSNETSQNMDIEIYSVLGQKMLSTSSSESTIKIELNSLPNGLYLVNINKNGLREVKRLKVNH
jgi:hypothetical protein